MKPKEWKIKKRTKISNIILASLVAMTFGALAYFCKRLIEENDKQHQKTRGDLKVLSGSVKEIKVTTEYLEKQLSDRRAQERFGTSPHGKELEKIKRKVSQTIIGIHQIQKEIDEKIAPQVGKNEKSFGEITWIKDEVSNQNKKLKVMYQILSTIVKNQKH